jgi:hypothetical protein
LPLAAHLAAYFIVPEQIWLSEELLAHGLHVCRIILVPLWRRDLLLENCARTVGIAELLRIIYVLIDGHAGVLRIYNLRRLVGRKMHP